MRLDPVRPERIEGTVAPGFESVKALFEQRMRSLAERSTQLCVYHRGERVVDLWAVEPASGFTPDTLVNVFSSGKTLEALGIAWLFDRGLLRYEDRVVEHWPAFQGEGRETLTIADVMRHEGGMAAFNTTLAPEDLLTANIKNNAVGRVIEQQPVRYPECGKREYHAITRGWVVNELFRRVEPAGRTLGEFVRDEFSEPLGIDTMIGVPSSALARTTDVVPLRAAFLIRQGFLPRLLGRRVDLNVVSLALKMRYLMRAMRKGSTPRAPKAVQGMDSLAFFNDPAMRRGETPSANTHSNARSLAKIAAVMAAGGTFEGREYFRSSAWEALHHDPTDGAFNGLMNTRFTAGGIAQFVSVPPGSSALERGLNTGREGFYGWFGLGGSVFQWHPEHAIGFAYVPTSLNAVDVVNERAKAYQAEVLRCVERLS